MFGYLSHLGVCSCIGGRVAGIAGGFLGLLGVDLFRVEGVLWPKICHCTVSPQQLFRVVNWLCQFCDSRSCTGHSFESAWLEELDRCMLRVIDVRWLVSDDRLRDACLTIDCVTLGV